MNNLLGYGYAGKAVLDTVSASVVGSVIGATQEVLLRELADVPMANSYLSGAVTKPPFLMAQMGSFGSPSVVTGLITGVAGVALGLDGLYKGHVIKSSAVASGVLGYGATSLGGAVLNGIYPSTAWANAVAKDPSNPISKKISIAPRPGANANQRTAAAVIGT